MPLPPGTARLDRSDAIPTLLKALQADETVKALVFLPGATDEFYFFRRAELQFTNARPTLLDAVTAFTNQTLVRVTFRPPLLLFHAVDDPVEPQVTIEHTRTAERLRKVHLKSQLCLEDHRWKDLHAPLQGKLNVFLKPPPKSAEAWHFYRHSLAAWNLDGIETLEAISLAGMTVCTVKNGTVVFEGDERPRPGSAGARERPAENK